jgi:hypothetical protein
MKIDEGINLSKDGNEYFNSDVIFVFFQRGFVLICFTGDPPLCLFVPMKQIRINPL